MTNREKFLALVSEDSDSLALAKQRRANKKLRRAAQKVSILILKRLKELGLSQRDLAEKMKVSPQLVNKWVKGKENNFSLDLLLRIGEVIGINLFEIPSLSPLAAPLSKKIEGRQVYEKNIEMDEFKVIHMRVFVTSDSGKEDSSLSNYPTLSQRIS